MKTTHTHILYRALSLAVVAIILSPLSAETQTSSSAPTTKIVPLSSKTFKFPQPPKILGEVFSLKAQEYGVDKDVLTAIGFMESGFRTNLLTRLGGDENAPLSAKIGIMGIGFHSFIEIENECLADENKIETKKDMFNPMNNIGVGACILSKCQKHYNLPTASPKVIACYDFFDTFEMSFIMGYKSN